MIQFTSTLKKIGKKGEGQPSLLFYFLYPIMNKLYTTPAWVTPERQQTIYGLLTIASHFPRFTKSLQFAHQMDLIMWYNSMVGIVCPHEGNKPLRRSEKARKWGN